MGGLVFWIIVFGFIIINVMKSKPQENEKKTDWDFSESPGEVLREQRRLAKQRLKSLKSESAVDFQPVEVKTGSAMADLIPIWEAAGRGNYEIVEEKLAAGANVNEPDTFFGETALHRAAKAGDLKMVQILLRYKARVDLENQYGETPLHFAIRGRNPDVIRLLLQQGADPDREDIFGRSPAQCASFYSELRDCFTGPTPT